MAHQLDGAVRMSADVRLIYGVAAGALCGVAIYALPGGYGAAVQKTVVINTLQNALV